MLERLFQSPFSAKFLQSTSNIIRLSGSKTRCKGRAPIRLSLTYPPSAGRNFSEILRAIDSLQLTDNQKVSTPVNWQPGKPVIISPSLSDEQAKERFPQGWKELRPYLRMVQLQD